MHCSSLSHFLVVPLVVHVVLQELSTGPVKGMLSGTGLHLQASLLEFQEMLLAPTSFVACGLRRFPCTPDILQILEVTVGLNSTLVRS